VIKPDRLDSVVLPDERRVTATRVIMTASQLPRSRVRSQEHAHATTERFAGGPGLYMCVAPFELSHPIFHEDMAERERGLALAGPGVMSTGHVLVQISVSVSGPINSYHLTFFAP
jgi:hypothetical protein